MTDTNTLSAEQRIIVEMEGMMFHLAKRFERGGGKVMIYVHNANHPDGSADVLTSTDDAQVMVEALRQFFENSGVPFP